MKIPHEKELAKHIPQEILASVKRECNEGVNTEGKSLVETLMAQKNKRQELAKKDVPLVEVNGYKLPLEGITLILFVLSTALVKLPGVAEILDQFDFTFKDTTGKQIYPAPAVSAKTKRKRGKKKVG